MARLEAELWPWFVFGVVVATLLGADLLLFHRRAEKLSVRQSALWAALFVSAGLLFSLFVGYTRGHEAAFAYLTAYLIEESLSVDNLFVFLALFTYFGVAREYQHRVLFWGIMGAIVMRGVFIVSGVALLNRFHWLVYILGAILVATGAKLGLGGGEEVHPDRNVLVRWASRVLPIVRTYHGQQFVVRVEEGWRFTPLALVLIAIESTDLMFAVDSVPAVLAVSRDVFVVYSSNIFAVIGLRALYSFLADAIGSLRFLKPALALVLVLIGAKMLVSEAVEIPTLASLAAVGTILLVATLASLLYPAGKAKGRSGGEAAE
ncbi:MAG: TerC/Alx family metal homeostasis membrane protein [Acidobacteriota bacterium]